MTSSKTSTNLKDGSHIVLEKLEELSIKNLDCELDDSPSYGTASLPTPEAPRVGFNLPMTRGSPYHTHHHHLWYDDEDEEISPPGAPLLKDMDSFTEGTGCGSFEDLPLAATNEFGDLIHSASEATVSLLPPPDSLVVSIERWRGNVLDDTSIPTKRRRSPSPEDERSHRRIRPRTRAMSLPSTFKTFTQYIGFSTARSEPDAPD